MGKHRDHRESRRRHQNDDADSFSEQASEPSYFRRPQTIMSDPVDADVLWFSASKGFGFVKLADDTEVYLPLRALEAAGSRGVSEGTHLKIMVGETPRGSQVMQVLEISDPIAKRPAREQIAGSPSTTACPRPEIEGTVKWYNPEKGFGFVAPDTGEKDVFVHASVLTRSGLSVLVEGQRVVFQSGQGKKGMEVRSIRLA
jgi:CspA family cold shock protein